MADTSTEQNIGEVIAQDSSSGSGSLDVGQTFDVAGSEDNSDQCSGVQGVGNTAPQQGGINTPQYVSHADEFGFEDIGGSSLNIIQLTPKPASSSSMVAVSHLRLTALMRPHATSKLTRQVPLPAKES